MVAANKALSSLNRIKAGMKTDKNLDHRKHARSEIKKIFGGPKKKQKAAVWKHRFVCLAHKDQEKTPTTDFAKDELCRAGLGEKEVVFPSLDMDADGFKEVLFNYFPKLREGGGYQMLKCLPNSRKLDVLSMSVYRSPSSLKERVGNARTYLRPIQRDLELESDDEENIEDTASVIHYIFACHYSLFCFFNSYLKNVLLVGQCTQLMTYKVILMNVRSICKHSIMAIIF